MWLRKKESVGEERKNVCVYDVCVCMCGGVRKRVRERRKRMCVCVRMGKQGSERED